jgi:hypothetical protein
MYDAQAVWLGDKLYVGGWNLMTESIIDEARLYIHTPTTDTWNRINTPAYWFALITYHSQLVLVGGREIVGEGRDGPVTNELWTLTEPDQWRETLPPMTRKRHHASAVEFADNILVAGGKDDNMSNVGIVEVYNGHHWAEAQCLPNPWYGMMSTVLNGHWYLMGGRGQGKEVCYASLDSLVASCQPSEKPLPSVWKRLPDVPHIYSSTAVFGNRLIAVGRQYSSSTGSSIHAYSPGTQSWFPVGNMPARLNSTCSVVLPTGDLMVVGRLSDAFMEEYSVHKASLKVDGNFCFYYSAFVTGLYSHCFKSTASVVSESEVPIILCPDPTPKRRKGSGEFGSFPWFGRLDGRAPTLLY